jgi:hypothetical protein
MFGKRYVLVPPGHREVLGDDCIVCGEETRNELYCKDHAPVDHRVSY